MFRGSFTYAVFFYPNPGFKQFVKFPLKILNKLLQNRVKLSTVLVANDWEMLLTYSLAPACYSCQCLQVL